MRIGLPNQSGRIVPYLLKGEPLPVSNTKGEFNRTAFAAAHVVANPFANHLAGIDWNSTLAYRSYLLDLGFGIAEAMDTSQRGMGLDWPSAHELIRKSLNSESRRANMIFSGCGTDQLLPADCKNLDDVIKAYLQQLNAIQKMNGRIILMASRALVKVAKSPADYLKVYARVLREADHPVILHWLGDMFDASLQGYWGNKDFKKAMNTCLEAISANKSKVDGIKISLLDDKKEVVMRRLLPANVKMYTGDDFNYPKLIAGDQKDFSHALLGIFDAIAPVASLALSALAQGKQSVYDKLLAPTIPLSRLIFRNPTQHYKTGIVFLAWLNGHQDHFVMISGAQGLRPLPDFINIFKLADRAALLSKPDLAMERMRQLLKQYGL